jgi:hypothetical protein
MRGWNGTGPRRLRRQRGCGECRSRSCRTRGAGAGQRERGCRGWRTEAGRRSRLVDAMAEGVVAAQGETGELLGGAGLQAGVVAARAGAEFVDAAEARVERVVVGEGREASGADVLIAVQLDLIRLVHGAGADVIDAHGAARAQLAFDSEAPFEEVGRLEGAGGEGVEVDRERAERWEHRRECALKGTLVGLRPSRRRRCPDSGRDANAADLSVDAADEDRRVGRVGCAEVGDLGGDDVVEEAAAACRAVFSRACRRRTRAAARLKSGVAGKRCGRWSGSLRSAAGWGRGHVEERAGRTRELSMLIDGFVFQVARRPAMRVNLG